MSRTITPAQQAFLGLSDEQLARAARIERLSPDQRRTERRRELLAQGIHPLTRLSLRPEGGTCGECAHCVGERHNCRTYWKCARVGSTNGPGTDLRKSWPACVRFEAAS